MRLLNSKKRIPALALASFLLSLLITTFCFSMATPVVAAESQARPLISTCESGSNYPDFSLKSDVSHPGMASCCLAKDGYFKTVGEMGNKLKLALDNSLIIKPTIIRLDSAHCHYLYHSHISPPPQLAALAVVVKRE